MIAPIAAVMIAPIIPPPRPMPIRRQQPAGDHRADDAEHDVAGEAEAAAGDDLTGDPAGNAADDDPYEDGPEDPLPPSAAAFAVVSTLSVPFAPPAPVAGPPPVPPSVSLIAQSVNADGIFAFSSSCAGGLRPA